MKKALSQKDFESYLENSNKMLGDFQLNLKELKDKILDFDSLLDNPI